jgi:hypothetical protein
MTEIVELHGLAGAPGELGPDGRARLPAALRPAVGSLDGLVAAISGPDELIHEAAAGLPVGAGLAEAVAVRLRRRGVTLAWGAPRHVDGDALAAVRAHGRASPAVARADPSLVPELALGSWFDATSRERLERRLLLAVRRATTVDSAFWHGVRESATRAEWRRWSRSSYVALVYHRFAGEGKVGQERVDVAPALFDRQLRLLRALGFRHVSADELLAFQAGQAGLPRRSFVVTVDDAIADCFEPLQRRGTNGPLLFVPTAEAGGRAHWLDDEPVLDWDEVRRLAEAGVAVGSHAAHHRRLTELGEDELERELREARSTLAAEVPATVPVVAYPNGAHDARVIAAARAAGERAAFTTEKGRNGAGTDPFCLRRVSVHGADGPVAVLWKVVTGSAIPSAWERSRSLRRWLARGRRARA